MSSLVAIQLKDKIYMGSDTAVSTNINGISYRQSNFGKKIYTTDDMLIFCSGNMSFAYMIMNEFAWEEDKTIANLQRIALKYYKLFNITDDRVEIMVGKIFKNCSCIYQISSYNKFKIIKHTNLNSENIGVWTGGFKTEESYNKTLENLLNKKSLIDTYKNVFNTISCEEIGGKLYLYELSINGTTKILDCDIKEKDSLRAINSKESNLHLINAEIIRGKLGQFAQVDANQITVGGEEKPLLDYIAEDLSIGIEGLDEAINSALGDGKLTNLEANSIKLALDKVVAESDNILSVATSLTITTEKTNYQTALTTLSDNLNNNWLGKVYPLTITPAQRTTISNQFKDLENKKTILVNKITEVRATKAYNDAKDYTDNNALKQNFYYNRTKITEAEGIEVFDNNNVKVLQIGGIDTTGNNVKDAYGFVAIHTNGSKTIVDGSGFKRQIISNGNSYNYINLNHADVAQTAGDYNLYPPEGTYLSVWKTPAELDALNVGIGWVSIPNLDFKGRQFIIVPSFLGYYNTPLTLGGTAMTNDTATIDIEVLQYDYPNGRFKIRARWGIYLTTRGQKEGEIWRGIKISYFAYAVS